MSRLRFSLDRFKRADRGLALIEFAYVAPILLTLFVGSFQISDAVFANRKVTTTARAIADLTSQYTSVDNPTLDSILNASRQIMHPYDLARTEARVSQITIDNSGNAVVNWSRALNATPLATGATTVIPSTLRQKNTTVILSQVAYHHVPSFASELIGPITLKDQTIMFPRKITAIQKK